MLKYRLIQCNSIGGAGGGGGWLIDCGGFVTDESANLQSTYPRVYYAHLITHIVPII